MKETLILSPLNENYTEDQKEIFKKNYRNIMEVINNLSKNSFNHTTSIIFDDFLEELNLDYESYIISIRSSLKADAIFLKRKAAHINVNVFNRHILELHQANMDIQFILNPNSLISPCKLHSKKYDRHFEGIT